MGRIILIVLLLGSMAWGQATQPATDLDKLDAKALRVMVKRLQRENDELKATLELDDRELAELKAWKATALATKPTQPSQGAAVSASAERVVAKPSEPAASDRNREKTNTAKNHYRCGFMSGLRVTYGR